MKDMVKLAVVERLRVGFRLRDDLLDRLCLGLSDDALFLEEIIDARTHMFLAHRSNSF